MRITIQDFNSQLSLRPSMKNKFEEDRPMKQQIYLQIEDEDLISIGSEDMCVHTKADFNDIF